MYHLAKPHAFSHEISIYIYIYIYIDKVINVYKFFKFYLYIEINTFVVT